jgi:hypothetical protein
MLFDSTTGGQNELITSGFASPPSAIPPLDGTIMDSGFSPDVLIFANYYSGTLYVDHYTLPTGRLGNKRYTGYSNVGGGDATLLSGSNPYGMALALNNTNTAGVTASSAAGAATATSGLEGLLPYEDLDLDPVADSVKVLIMMVRGDGEVGNQLLPGLGGGHSDLGYTPDLTGIAGQQYVEVSLAIQGDYDVDRDVDLTDYSWFDDCLTGPDPAAPPTTPCEVFDFNQDADVDLGDYRSFTEAILDY